MIFTGELITSADALAMGLLNRVMHAAEVFAQAQKIAAIITQKGRKTIQSALGAIRTGLENPLIEGLGREFELFRSLCETGQ